MADPRSFTVRPCPGPYASKSAASLSSAMSTRKNFFNSLGKIGDLEVLNSIGGGSIGTGLRTLSSISNTIRTGCGSLPTAIGQSLDQGANWVLENIGITPAVIQTLQQFNPGVANQAYGQAKQVYEQIKSGTFKATDIPFYLQDFQNLERLVRGIYVPGDDRYNSLRPVCEASPYAVDLIARAPKYKFLFVVQFVPNSGYTMLGNDFMPLDMAFAVKKSTRPNVKFQLEDVNYYNYRTKVVTKTEFEEMQMSFHDDVMNLAGRFYAAYLKASSPITNLSSSAMTASDLLEQGGMQFVGNTLSSKNPIEGAAGVSSDYTRPSGGIPSNTYAATIGPLANDNKTIFSEIILYHVFDAGQKINAYHFFNPRISRLSLDDVDMSIGTEGTELSINFAYDSVYIDNDIQFSDRKTLLQGTQRGAIYPLRYNDSASAARGPNTNGISPTGRPISSSSSCDPLSSVNTKANPIKPIVN